MTLEVNYMTLPEFEDGDNGWYVSPTEMYLVPSTGESVLVYWKWNSESWTSGEADGYEMVDIGYMESGSNILYYYASGEIAGSGEQSTSYSNTFYFDDDIPDVAISSPSGESWYGEITVEASGSDSLSGVESLSIYMDNWLLYTEYSGEISYVLDTTTYADGTHFLDVAVRDRAGWVYSSGMSGIIDNNPPDLAVLTPPGNVLTESNYTVSGEATDMYSNVESVEYTYYIVNSGSDNWAEVAYSSGENTSYATWYAEMTGLTDGVWVLKLRATDVLGNVTPSGEYDIYSFLVDIG